MANNETIVVRSIVKCYPTKYNASFVDYTWFDCYIKGIDNSELILFDEDRTVFVPFSQLKWGTVNKFKNEENYIYIIDTVFLVKGSIENKSEFSLSNTTQINLNIQTNFFREKNPKCPNIMFCSANSDDKQIRDIVKYPIPITKILLFVAGHADPTSPVACLIKDIFPIIFEFYQQIHPLLEADNI